DAAPTGKRGRQKTCSDTAIRSLGTFIARASYCSEYLMLSYQPLILPTPVKTTWRGARDDGVHNMDMLRLKMCKLMRHFSCFASLSRIFV
ncbi:hypothetical protein, partial [Salipiger aestuarii]|uniref:hypothetical protein n=1 Tax=Salipiger aestuarii TaxID=568098 RepID=UPI001CC2D12A